MQAEAGEDATVGVVHHAVGFLQAIEAGVKGVGVLHHEFACAHHAEARAHLVTKLGLDLVKIKRQLAVALHFTACDVGDDFLVGGAEAEQVVVTVFDFQHLRTEYFPAPRLLPQFGRLHGGHQQFDAAAPVHFLAYYGFDFAQHAQPQRHPGIKSAGQFLDVARAQHQAMADQFSFRGGFFQG